MSRLCSVLLIGGLAACKTDEVRGVLAAKFTDGSARFVKRISLVPKEGTEFRLLLASKTRRCELFGLPPADAIDVDNDCKGAAGTGVLRCQDLPEIPLWWRLTSCHGGYGRSQTGGEPAFLFGFSGNLNSAQNQMDLAEGAAADIPGQGGGGVTALDRPDGADLPPAALRQLRPEQP